MRIARRAKSRILWRSSASAMWLHATLSAEIVPKSMGNTRGQLRNQRDSIIILLTVSERTCSQWKVLKMPRSTTNCPSRKSHRDISVGRLPRPIKTPPVAVPNTQQACGSRKPSPGPPNAIALPLYIIESDLKNSGRCVASEIHIVFKTTNTTKSREMQIASIRRAN